MSDLIDRQAAIDAIHKEFDEVCVWDESGQTTANEVENILYEVPSAEPERKKGYWVPVTNGRGGFKCDQCHNYAPSYQNGDEYLSYFCPNCGARMEIRNNE